MVADMAALPSVDGTQAADLRRSVQWTCKEEATAVAD